MIALPPPGEYWQASPEKEKGDADAKELYQAVGVALSTWESAEEAFAALFGLLVESKSRAALRAYGAIVGAIARRKALCEAAIIFFNSHKASEQDIADFNILMKHFEFASEKRNHFAHGIVINCQYNTEDCGCFLMPPQYNSSKTFAFPKLPIIETSKFPLNVAKYRYDSVQVIEFMKKFSILRQAAYGYCQLHITHYLKKTDANVTKSVQ